MRNKGIALFALLISGAQPAFSEGTESLTVKDPFTPFVGGAGAVSGTLDQVDENKPPLLKFPVGAYNVTAIISSAKRSIAMVQTPLGSNLYVKPGSYLGAEGFQIKAIKELTLHLENENGDEIELMSQSIGAGAL